MKGFEAGEVLAIQSGTVATAAEGRTSRLEDIGLYAFVVLRCRPGVAAGCGVPCGKAATSKPLERFDFSAAPEELRASLMNRTLPNWARKHERWACRSVVMNLNGSSRITEITRISPIATHAAAVTARLGRASG